MTSSDYLFRDIDGFGLQQHNRDSMQSEISTMSADRLLNTNTDDLVSYLTDRYGIEVPVLHEDQKVADQREARRDVSSGTKY